MATPMLSTLSINGDRFLASIATLAQIGQLPNGGVERLAYSPADIKARQLVQQWMLGADMQVRIDAGGNIIGRYAGSNPDLPAIATGSHIDTVPNAGHYDGAYGVLAALEVIRTLKENSLQLNHPLEAIVFADEEGSMIGSKAITGNINPNPDSYHPVEGTIQTCLASIGGDWQKIETAQRDRNDFAAFLELHVEQGPVLDSAGIQIGVVEGVVGQRRYTITVQGSASHAGTTPMSMRQDALVAAAQVILSVNLLANLPGKQVATVGKMLVSPNAPNTIPAFVEMSLDVRDLSDHNLDDLINSLESDLEAVAAATQTKISLKPVLQNQPALASPIIQTAIVQTCRELELTSLHLPSRAGHDAQEMAKLTEMGMIFVPSQNGVSHSETEYTSPEHCVQGANVLLHTLLKLDRQI
ncbi:Zn-dependent hydrolase [Tumidithrix helvetica]|uniref:Zn-dependent hydrolase n=1 Tax=Tumidithrix helvetica TaxID=3457545 RepID=UPI003CC57D2C